MIQHKLTRSATAQGCCSHMLMSYRNIFPASCHAKTVLDVCSFTRLDPPLFLSLETNGAPTGTAGTGTKTSRNLCYASRPTRERAFIYQTVTQTKANPASIFLGRGSSFFLFVQMIRSLIKTCSRPSQGSGYVMSSITVGSYTNPRRLPRLGGRGGGREGERGGEV